jgi:hypothetical protein
MCVTGACGLVHRQTCQRLKRDEMVGRSERGPSALLAHGHRTIARQVHVPHRHYTEPTEDCVGHYFDVRCGCQAYQQATHYTN